MTVFVWRGGGHGRRLREQAPSYPPSYALVLVLSQCHRRVFSAKMFPLYIKQASLRRVRVMHASCRMAEPSACFMPAVFILYAAVDDKHLFAARMRIPPQFASRRYSDQAGESLAGLRIVVER